MRLDQLYFGRPVAGYADYSTPIKNLFVCGSGAHPGLFCPVCLWSFCLLTVIELIEDLCYVGGGVMGAAGRNSALSLLRRVGKQKRS